LLAELDRLSVIDRFHPAGKHSSGPSDFDICSRDWCNWRRISELDRWKGSNSAFESREI